MSSKSQIVAFSQHLDEKLKSWEKDYVRTVTPNKVGKEISSVPTEGGKTKLRNMLSIGLRAKRRSNSKAGVSDPHLRMLPPDVARTERGGVTKKASVLQGGKAVPANAGLDLEKAKETGKQELDATSQRQAAANITPSAVGATVRGTTGVKAAPMNPVTPDVQAGAARKAEKADKQAEFVPDAYHLTNAGTAERVVRPPAITTTFAPASAQPARSRLGGDAVRKVAVAVQDFGRTWSGRKTAFKDRPNPLTGERTTLKVGDSRVIPTRTTLPGGETLRDVIPAKNLGKENAKLTKAQAPKSVRPAPPRTEPHRAPREVSVSGRPNRERRQWSASKGPENSSKINFSVSLGKYLTEHRYD